MLPTQLWCAQCRELLPEERLIARFSIGRSHLEFAAVPKHVAEPIGTGNFRKNVVLVDIAVDTAAFGAQPGLQQQVVIQQFDFLLTIESDRTLGGQILGRRGVRALIHVPLTGQQVLRADVERGQLPIFVLQAERGRRRKGARG